MQSYQQQDLLSDLETTLVRADSGKRIINYIIDSIVCGLCIGFIQIAIKQNEFSGGLVNSLIKRLQFLIFYGILMGFQEAIFKGKTLGKLITSTKAVNINGGSISFKTALLRGIIRAIPFEQFSALAGYGAPNPWHDKWSDTMVVDMKKSSFIQE